MLILSRGHITKKGFQSSPNAKPVNSPSRAGLEGTFNSILLDRQRYEALNKY